MGYLWQSLLDMLVTYYDIVDKVSMILHFFKKLYIVWYNTMNPNSI